MEPVAVGKAGERVARGQVLDAFLGLALRSHVAAHAAVARERAIGAAQRLAADPNVAQRAVRQAAPHHQLAEGLPVAYAACHLRPAFVGLESEFAPGPAQLFGEGALVAEDVAPFQAREAPLRVLLPEPVRRQRGQAAEALLAVAQRALGARALGDIRVQRDEAARRQGPAGDLKDRAVRSLAHEVVGLEAARLRHARLDLLLGVAGAVVATLGVEADQDIERRARHTQRIRIVEQFAEAAVDDHQTQFAVEDADAGVHRLEHALEHAVGLAQRLFGGQRFGDVARHAHVAAEAAVFVERRHAAGTEAAPLSAGVAAAVAKVEEAPPRLQRLLVRLPGAAVADGLDIDVPARTADEVVGAKAAQSVDRAPHGDEAQIRVLLPAEVGGQLEQLQPARRGIDCGGAGCPGSRNAPRSRAGSCGSAGRLTHGVDGDCVQRGGWAQRRGIRAEAATRAGAAGRRTPQACAAASRSPVAGRQSAGRGIRGPRATTRASRTAFITG